MSPLKLRIKLFFKRLWLFLLIVLQAFRSKKHTILREAKLLSSQDIAYHDADARTKGTKHTFETCSTGGHTDHTSNMAARRVPMHRADTQFSLLSVRFSSLFRGFNTT